MNNEFKMILPNIARLLMAAMLFVLMQVSYIAGLNFISEDFLAVAMASMIIIPFILMIKIDNNTKLIFPYLIVYLPMSAFCIYLAERAINGNAHSAGFIGFFGLFFLVCGFLLYDAVIVIQYWLKKRQETR